MKQFTCQMFFWRTECGTAEMREIISARIRRGALTRSYTEIR